MLTIRRSSDRGYFDFGWLKTFHTFSFGDYYDPRYMHFETLRVINHDFIAAGVGFPTHPHKDMEILTYVLSGTVAHKDSMGNQTQITAGEAQIMSAGSGITHSELNASQSQELELLQIWILPNKKNIQPRYGQFEFSRQEKLNHLCKIADPMGGDKVIQIFQDVTIHASILEPGSTLDVDLKKAPAWIQVARGEIKVNGEALQTGDGVAIRDIESLKLTATKETEFLLFSFPT